MSTQWKQRREGGGWFALWIIRAIGRYGGRRVGRACLYPITLYFLLRRGAERRDSRAWLTRALGRPATLLDVARHIHCFASTILDRVFLLGESTRRFDVRVHGLEFLQTHLERGHGLLLFGSHLGSFEVLRVLARDRPDCRLRVVLDKSHNPAMQALLDALNPELARGIIDAGQDGPALMLEIQEAVQSGALVALLVDRVQPGGESFPASFLGTPARFPVAPWLIAAVLKAPVALGFGLYRGGNRYDLVFEGFSDGIDAPRPHRRAAVAALIQRYAARLEHHALDAPYNWFNFYDFWTHDDSSRDDASHDGRTDDGRSRDDAHEHAGAMAGDGAGAAAGRRSAVGRAA